MKVQDIPVGLITAEEHSQRLEINEERLQELVSSISSEGLLQPLSVRQDGEQFMIVFGHRRFEACKRLGHEMVPCIVATGDEASIRSKTFNENFFREDLTAVELAVAIADEVKSERMTIDQLAFGFKKTTDWVRRQIAICSWPEDVLEGIHTGRLSIAAASNLSVITEENYRKMLVSQAVENGATARTTAAWLQAWRSMLPMAEAIEQPPVEAGESAAPMVPQAPCLACHKVYRVDELSHVPLCRFCIKAIAEAGQQE
jgi:ParB family chromosome partitioning protein